LSVFMKGSSALAAPLRQQSEEASEISPSPEPSGVIEVIHLSVAPPHLGLECPLVGRPIGVATLALAMLTVHVERLGEQDAAKGAFDHFQPVIPVLMIVQLIETAYGKEDGPVLKSADTDVISIEN